MKSHHKAALAYRTLLVCFCTIGCNGANGNPSTTTGTSVVPHAGTCADPARLSGTINLESESTSHASNAMSAEDGSCIGYKTQGAEQVYVITLTGSGTTKLHVSATPSKAYGPDAFDPVIYLTENCTSQPSCITAADNFGAGSAESIEYTNTTGKNQELFVVVDGYDFQNVSGDFKLAVDLLDP